MDNLGQKLKWARESSGLTQEKLAERVGVSRTAVARWESNDNEPTLQNLVRLAGALNVSTDWLLTVGRSGTDVLSELPEQALTLLRQFISQLRRL